jgi:hypothetical protein
LENHYSTAMTFRKQNHKKGVVDNFLNGKLNH